MNKQKSIDLLRKLYNCNEKLALTRSLKEIKDDKLAKKIESFIKLYDEAIELLSIYISKEK